MKVRTVLGDVAAGELGVTDSHDHLFFKSALLAGQELDDPAAAVQEAKGFKQAGGQTIVQWTPYGLGRGAEWLAKVSEEAGVHVVAATGFHRAEHYAVEVVERVRPRLAELFVDELTSGIGATGVKAGMIKVAGGFHVLDEHATYVLRAAAQAHLQTGAPIGVHHELGSGPDAVLDLLTEQGVPPGSVILGHLNRFPDHELHLELAARGAFLAFDGPSRANNATDPHLFECLAALIDGGYAGQLLLGGDTTTARARAATGEGPGMPYLLTGIRPRLIRRFGEDLATQVFVTNPASAFAAAWGGTVRS
jgi:predicted metal-dependent phosphotriesterase family hydrolase